MFPPETRMERWGRTMVGYGILSLAMLSANWYSVGVSLAEKAPQLRGDNEARAMAWVESPKSYRYVPPEASVVRAYDLARSYHDGRRSAEYAYTGQTVTVPLRVYHVRGREIHWHLGDSNIPAVVVMELAEGGGVPAKAANHRVLWVTGRCEGRFDDGIGREFGGYGFHIRISGCRAVLD